MRTFGKLALGLGLVVLSAAPALAQRGGGGFGGPAMFLTNKGVQQEIKASDEQASKLNTLGEEIRTKQTEARQGLQDLPQDERRAKMTEANKTLQADVNKGLAEILKPEQVKRFHQIQLQQAGSNGLLQTHVADKLKLTDDQKTKVGDINKELMTSMGELRGQFQNDREGTMKKMAESRKSANEKALDVLTSEQKTTYKDLVGASYEFKFEPRPNN